MKIHRLILIAMLFITSYPLYSQTVRGNGTVSDEQGVFSLPAHEAGGLLRISSIGYTTAYKPCEVTDLGHHPIGV